MGEKSDELDSAYYGWERRMGEAADSAECERPMMPNGNSADCPCGPCQLACWWDNLDGLERGILFAAMVDRGFRWPEYPEAAHA